MTDEQRRELDREMDEQQLRPDIGARYEWLEEQLMAARETLFMVQHGYVQLELAYAELKKTREVAL